jgi:hypothetical protein
VLGRIETSNRCRGLQHQLIAAVTTATNAQKITTTATTTTQDQQQPVLAGPTQASHENDWQNCHLYNIQQSNKKELLVWLNNRK